MNTETSNYVEGSRYLPLNSTDDVSGPEDESEGDQVAEHEAAEEHIGELSASSLDDRSVVVVSEHSRHEECGETAGEGETHGADGPGALGPQEVLRYVQTELVMVVGLGAQRTHDTLRLVVRVTDLGNKE